MLRFWVQHLADGRSKQAGGGHGMAVGPAMDENGGRTIRDSDVFSSLIVDIAPERS